MDWTVTLVFWLVTLVLLAAQVVLALHALRAGKTLWAVFVMLMPLLGTLSYYFTQYRPDLHARRLEEGATEEAAG